MSTHGHKVLEMMAGNSYTEESLLDAIQTKFGADALFHTCSAKELSAKQLIEFLAGKGKFLPLQANTFTVDKSSVCDHE